MLDADKINILLSRWVTPITITQLPVNLDEKN